MTLGLTFPRELESRVLDHGHLGVIDWTLDDLSVLAAARRLYAGAVAELDDAQLAELLFTRRDAHRVLGLPQVMFLVKCPLFVKAEWHRHRQWRYNEISGRYTELRDEFYDPQRFLRRVPGGRKYEFEWMPDDGGAAQTRRQALHSDAYRAYHEALAEGQAHQHARMHLPFDTYTHFYATTSLWWVFHFLNLRADREAQLEIQEYALAMAALVARLYPRLWAAFVAVGWKGNNPALTARAGQGPAAERPRPDLSAYQFDLEGGWMRLEDAMGGDRAVVLSARVSYGNTSEGELRDRGLVNFLARDRHSTPFEHPSFNLHVSAPRDLVPEFLEWAWSPNHKLPSEVWLRREDPQSFDWPVNARALLEFVRSGLDELSPPGLRPFALAAAQTLRATMPWTFDSYLLHRWPSDDPEVASWREAAEARFAAHQAAVAAAKT